MKNKLHPTLIALAMVAALAGCASNPPSPVLDLPNERGTVATPAEYSRWWLSFNDSTLTALVDEALSHNASVLGAAQNVEQSKSTLSQAEIALLPDVNLSLRGSRQNPSDATAQPGYGNTSNNYRGGISMSYEIDLWGRIWKAKDAALANLLASQYARDAASSAVAAQTARSYFALLALDANAALLSQTLTTRDEALVLLQKRFAAGAASDYELKLAEVERASVAAALPAAIAAREKAEASLAVLLGRSPKDIIEGRISRGSGLETLAQSPEIPAGLPADLLTRRPDVRQAAAQLAVADASLSEARRRYFPSLSLTGFLGGENVTFGKLMDGAARTWNIGAAITQPLVGLAKINADVDAAKSQRVQAEIAYAESARAAYADVRSALASHRAARESLIATQARMDSQLRVKELTDKRYKAGVSSFLDTLNAERDRLGAARDRVSALENRLSAMVSVYQALGGGWNEATLIKSP